MRYRSFFGWGVAVLIIGPSSSLCAQSLSDFDIGALENRSGNAQTRAHVNPFAKGSSTAEEIAVEDLQLTGIVFKDESVAFALISGYLVKPGDKIAGFKVDRIENTKVHLKRLDETIVLSLGGGI